MELERELPTDDASIKLEGGCSRGEVKPSDSMLTLKCSWSQETIIASSGEPSVSSELCLDAIHLDLLVKKGLIEYDLLDQHIVENEAVDYPSRLNSSSDLRGIAEIVKEMRNEFIDKLSSNVKGIKGILTKGMVEQEDGSSVIQDHNSEKANATKKDLEVELEVPKLKNDNDSHREELLTKDVNRGEEIIQLISDINQFTSEIERDPDSVNWSQFRANLLKIHRYYVRSPESRAHSQNEVPTSDICLPLNDIKSHAKYLRRNIRGLQSKKLTLDNHSLTSKEDVERDMVVLSMIRDRISQRLKELEDEFRMAREQLFRGAKVTEQRKQPDLPTINNCSGWCNLRVPQ